MANRKMRALAANKAAKEKRRVREKSRNEPCPGCGGERIGTLQVEVPLYAHDIKPEKLN